MGDHRCFSESSRVDCCLWVTTGVSARRHGWSGRGSYNNHYRHARTAPTPPVTTRVTGDDSGEQGNRLGKISSSNLQDEAPMPLPVVGPLFISLLLFHLSRVLLGAWRFGLFPCVYSSFRNRLDLIREPAFYWAFYFSFPIYPCLFHLS